MAKTAEPDTTGRQVQRRTDRAAKTAGSGNSIEHYRGVKRTDGPSVVSALGRRGCADGVHAAVVRPIPIDHDTAVDEEHLVFLPTPLGRVAK